MTDCHADLVRSGDASCFRGSGPSMTLPLCLPMDGMPCTDPTISFLT